MRVVLCNMFRLLNLVPVTLELLLFTKARSCARCESSFFFGFGHTFTDVSQISHEKDVGIVGEIDWLINEYVCVAQVFGASR